jgi:hypothetical protein
MQQLVLQFSPWGSDTHDFDKLISLEEQLIDALAGKAEVDGHDMGSDEANIFIHTLDAHTTFSDSFPVVQRSGLVPLLGAAYREAAVDEYIRLWPKENVAAFSIK